MENPEFTIGADPEIVLVKSNNTLLRVRGVIPDRGQFGVDGHGYIAELRPEPAIYPTDLTENIRSALASKYHRLKNYKWKAGPWVLDKPLGGHVHFGIPMEDNLVAALEKLMPIILALIEPESSAKQRRTFPFYRGTPYGLLGDSKSKDWGWEWRVPSSFIVAPGITTAVLALHKAILYEELFKGSNSYTKLTRGRRHELQFKKDDFHLCKRKTFLPLLDPLWDIISQLLYFQKNHEGANLWSSVAYLRRFAIEKGGFFVPSDIKVKSKWSLEATAPKDNTEEAYNEDGGAQIQTMEVPTRRPTLNDLRNPATIFTPDFIMED